MSGFIHDAINNTIFDVLSGENTDVIICNNSIDCISVKIDFNLSRTEKKKRKKKKKIRSKTSLEKVKKEDNILKDEDMCCICIQKFKIKEKVRKLPCKHNFHKKCIDKWYNKKDDLSCPICRTKL
jgi:hypothetical protein